MNQIRITGYKIVLPHLFLYRIGPPRSRLPNSLSSSFPKFVDETHGRLPSNTFGLQLPDHSHPIPSDCAHRTSREGPWGHEHHDILVHNRVSVVRVDSERNVGRGDSTIWMFPSTGPGRSGQVDGRLMLWWWSRSWCTLSCYLVDSGRVWGVGVFVFLIFTDNKIRPVKTPLNCVPLSIGLIWCSSKTSKEEKYHGLFSIGYRSDCWSVFFCLRGENVYR